MSDWFSDEKATFGDRLASGREAAGLSEAELAGRLGVSRSTAQRWEDDRSEPRGNRLQMLAGLLNVSLTWLLSGRGAGVPPPGDDRPPVPEDLGAVLTDLGLMRAEMQRLTARAAALERRLRRLARA